MEYSWSRFAQNIWHLEASRIIGLGEEAKASILCHLPVLEKAEIADIGCGTGIFTRFLDERYSNCSICGVDLDQCFIEEAQNKISPRMNNTYQFLVGDGYNLPFEENHFDLTVSHTYLTSVQDPKKALSEMIRVTKRGGFVASITAQSLKSLLFSPGNYKNDYYNTYLRYWYLRTKLEEVTSELFSTDKYIIAKYPERIPQLFGLSGLRQIAMYPIGFAFSLSDSHIANETKVKYIQNYCKGELMRLQEIEAVGGCSVTKEELSEYKNLLLQHTEKLLGSLGENTVWEWVSGLNILMIGQKPKYL